MIMATPDPAHDGLSAEELRDERRIAAVCRIARLRNEEIYKKREQLRKEIRDIHQRSNALEGRYWHEYQVRLADIAQANPKWSTRKWSSAFGENEKKLADAVAKRLDKLRKEQQIKQDELATLDSEFWSAWSKHVDFMRGLTPQPPSSGSTPAAMLPDVAPQPADNQASSALPATHSSGNRGPRGSAMHSTNRQKQSASGKSSAASESLPKTSTAAMKGANTQSHSLSQPSQGLVGDAMQPVQSASPLTAPTPLSHVSSPDPSIPATASEQRRRLRSSAAGPSALVRSNDRKTRPKALTPRSLTPKSASAGVESRGQSAQEPADNAQPAKAHKAVPAGSRSSKIASAAANPVKPTAPTLPKLITPRNQDTGFVGVTNPVVGEIYQGFYKDEHYRGWWMCTPLPWEAWEREIGINYSFHQADLFKDLPGCYTTARVRAKPKSRKMKTVITGWEEGFEADGPKARERVFPVLFFDDVEGEPGHFKFPDSPEKVFSFSKRTLRALPAEWVAAADLRLPGVDVGRPVQGRDTAERFRERVRARRALQAKKKFGTPKKARTGISASVEAGSPMEASSAVDLSSVVEDTTREDIEMVDAESLSGATAVDDTAGQPYTLKSPKTPPTARISLKGAAGQADLVKAEIGDSAEATPSSNASRGWRAVIFGEDSGRRH